MRTFQSGDATGYFFILFFLYSLASLPMAYSYSFRPRTSIIGLTNFFIINAMANIVDAIVNSVTVFRRNENPSAGPSQLYRTITNVRWILAGLFPSVNLKHGLFNSQLHEDRQCIITFNRYIGTSLSVNEPWNAMNKPGLGTQILIFFIQIFFWTAILTIVERRAHRGQICCGSNSSSDPDEEQIWNDTVS